MDSYAQSYALSANVSGGMCPACGLHVSRDQLHQCARSGWQTCGVCGSSYRSGTFHLCPGSAVLSQTSVAPKPRTIEDRLSDIESLLERLVERYCPEGK